MTVPSFELQFQWRPVLLQEGGGGYLFPAMPSAFFRNEYSRPLVYRWRVFPGDQGRPEELYIGEAEDLARRVRPVIAPGKEGKRGETNERLRKELQARIGTGKHVALEWLEFSPFELNNILFRQEDLREPFCRKAIENLSLYFAQKRGHPLLNRYADPVEKVARNLLKLPPSVLRRALEIANAGKS